MIRPIGSELKPERPAATPGLLLLHKENIMNERLDALAKLLATALARRWVREQLAGRERQVADADDQAVPGRLADQRQGCGADETGQS